MEDKTGVEFSKCEEVKFNMALGKMKLKLMMIPMEWLVGCFGFNGPLRQYFSLYQAVSQREG